MQALEPLARTWVVALAEGGCPLASRRVTLTGLTEAVCHAHTNTYRYLWTHGRRTADMHVQAVVARVWRLWPKHWRVGGMLLARQVRHARDMHVPLESYPGTQSY